MALPACGGDDESGADAGPNLPTWSRELPSAADAIGARRGLSPARGIIHLHSPYSHDACDGDPRQMESSGPINEPCLSDLRQALCDTRQNYAAMTDHDDSMAEESWETLFLVRGTDELVTNTAGDTIASRMKCENGHEVLIFVGGENGLMPIMMDHHPVGTVSQVHDFYNDDSPSASEAFRNHGGMTWINHAEEKSIDWIRDRNPDGLEIYQLHANIDPNIREEHLGLDAAGAIASVVEFADPQAQATPDLALLSFLEANSPAIAAWDTLLGEGKRVSGSGGTDAHQNAVNLMLSDGERGDSYRRMIRWFSNVALVDDVRDPEAVEDAVRRGRFFVSFDMFGQPAGFDVVAMGASAGELGDEVSVSEGATLEVTLPTVYMLDPSLPAPIIRARILRVDSTGTTEVADAIGAKITAPLDAVGAYRVEVLITPSHLGPYLGKLEDRGWATREHVWVYANPIYVKPPF